MKYFSTQEKIIIGLVLAALVVGIYATKDNNTDESFAGSNASQRCDVSSVAKVEVGDESSTQILAAAGNRAWARIQQPANATNTVNLNFNEGEAAVLTSGILLGDGTSTSSIDFIDFGLNTFFPYTGVVTGLTNVGSTTLLITECKYTS